MPLIFGTYSFHSYLGYTDSPNDLIAPKHRIKRNIFSRPMSFVEAKARFQGRRKQTQAAVGTHT